MKEKPILFNAEMVRAILEGRKTVTRRLIKPRYRDGDAGFWVHRKVATGEITGVEIYDEDECGTDRYVMPPYQTGDILYVRETWRKEDNGFAYYATDWHKFGDEYVKQFKWNPSIHMPKEAARIWLKVTNVRLERLQAMTEEDALKEGAKPGYLFEGDAEPTRTALRIWLRIWDSTIKKKDLPIYGWVANPWCFVISFERIEKGDSDED